ncbi:uncharacterized protein EDB93DRAFT_1249552 [Suillus bovinus]|uniref:uncharacterized protein n=1 Tax=Suillus bovinus TaxID=48563 RepID=UPI001B88612A|nr:uncharacterized protein EDB93DRAFT_1249552 [Suillus bovinus]KAG2151058.1 hypothetical protein EDB93DRAFT_1249552 [Suillus bovinus]
MSEAQFQSPSEDTHVNQTHPMAAPMVPDLSMAVPTLTKARAKHCIAALEEELETMKQEKGTKQRFVAYCLCYIAPSSPIPHGKTTYYIAQGRAICHMTVLYSNLEDLITENDHRYEESLRDSLVDATPEQDRLQCGYLALAQAIPWLHSKLVELDIDNCEDMLKKLKRGADMAHGDDTSTLKDLIVTWINQDFQPSPLLRSDSKQLCGFAHDVSGRLLCPAEWDWSNNQ